MRIASRKKSILQVLSDGHQHTYDRDDECWPFEHHSLTLLKFGLCAA